MNSHFQKQQTQQYFCTKHLFIPQMNMMKMTVKPMFYNEYDINIYGHWWLLHHLMNTCFWILNVICKYQHYSTDKKKSMVLCKRNDEVPSLLHQALDRNWLCSLEHTDFLAGYGLSQSEEKLLCNTSHWPSPYPEWCLVDRSNIW